MPYRTNAYDEEKDVPKPVEVEIRCKVWLKGEWGTAKWSISRANFCKEFHEILHEELIEGVGELQQRKVIAVDVMDAYQYGDEPIATKDGHG